MTSDPRPSSTTGGYSVTLIVAMAAHVLIGALTLLGGRLAYVWLPLWFVGLVLITRNRGRGAVVLAVPITVLGIMVATAVLFGDWAGLTGDA